MDLSKISAKQMAWAFLIKKGELTNGEWSFYGSSYNPPEAYNEIRKKFRSWGEQNREYEKYLEKVYSDIKNVGVDWNKTEEPQSDEKCGFNGTFAEEHRPIEILIGTLVLKNGDEYTFWNRGEHDSITDMMGFFKLLESLNGDFETVFGDLHGF